MESNHGAISGTPAPGPGRRADRPARDRNPSPFPRGFDPCLRAVASRRPASRTSQMIARWSFQILSVPDPPPCFKLLVAISSADSTNSLTRFSPRPKRDALTATNLLRVGQMRAEPKDRCSADAGAGGSGSSNGAAMSSRPPERSAHLMLAAPFDGTGGCVRLRGPRSGSANRRRTDRGAIGRGVREREVEQGLVSLRTRPIPRGCVPPRSARRSPQPDAGIGVLVHELPPHGDDANRIRAHLGHVDEPDLVLPSRPIGARNRSIIRSADATNTGSSFSTASRMNGAVRSRKSASPE